MDEPSVAEAGRRGGGWIWGVLAVVLACQAVVLAAHFGPAYSGPDAPGYFFNGRLLATQGTGEWRPSSAAEWLVVHYNDGGDGGFRSRYPPGFPLMLAAAYRIGGPTAALALNPLLVVSSTLLLFLLARRWVRPWLAVLAAAALATVPSLAEQAYLGFAHVPVLFLLLLGLLFLDLWMERPRPLLGLLAGACLGTMPSVRYGAVMLGLGAVAALAHWMRSKPPDPRSVAWPVIGALVPLALLALYQERAFGSPLATGYGTTGEASAFGFGYVRRNWLGYWTALMSNMGAFAVVGLLGIAGMLASWRERGRGLLLGISFVASLGLYLSYYWSIQDFRFLIPVVPLLVLGAVCGIDRLPTSRLRMVLGATLAGLHMMIALPDASARLRRANADVVRAVAAVSALEEVADTGSVVVGTLGLNMVLAFDGRWRLGDASLLRIGPPPPLPPAVPPPFDEQGRPQPSPIQPGRGASLRSRYAGLTPPERSRAALEDLLGWSADGDVFWINPGDDVGDAGPIHADLGRFDLVREVVLPRVPASARGFGSPDPDGRPQFWTLPDTLRIYAFSPFG